MSISVGNAGQYAAAQGMWVGQNGAWVEVPMGGSCAPVPTDSPLFYDFDKDPRPITSWWYFSAYSDGGTGLPTLDYTSDAGYFVHNNRNIAEGDGLLVTTNIRNYGTGIKAKVNARIGLWDSSGQVPSCNVQILIRQGFLGGETQPFTSEIFTIPLDPSATNMQNAQWIDLAPVSSTENPDGTFTLPTGPILMTAIITVTGPGTANYLYVAVDSLALIDQATGRPVNL